MAGFAAVGAGAHRSATRILRTPEEPTVRLWGGFHLPSVGLALAGSSLIAALVHGALALPLVGFSATAVYLLVIAA